MALRRGKKKKDEAAPVGATPDGEMAPAPAPAMATEGPMSAVAVEAPPAAASPAPAAPAKGRAKTRAAKPPKAERRREPTTTLRGTGGLLDLSDRMPSREEMEREAAAELEAAVAPSWNLLRREVPDATSPADAERKIEAKLGPAPPDVDAGIPSHPIYSGDALVYKQLRRHYGAENPGGSFWRSWHPLSGR